VSNKEARKRLTKLVGTPVMGLGHMNAVCQVEVMYLCVGSGFRKWKSHLFLGFFLPSDGMPPHRGS